MSSCKQSSIKFLELEEVTKPSDSVHIFVYEDLAFKQAIRF